MNVKNSKNKNNNLQKSLPNAVTIFFFLQIVRSLVLFPFMFPHSAFEVFVDPRYGQFLVVMDFRILFSLENW